MKYIPNLLTLLRCIVTLFIIYYRSIGSEQMMLPLVLVGLVTDYLDGVIARRYSVSTQFGKQFDHYSDKFFIISVFILILIELLPYETTQHLILGVCIMMLIIRDFYIGRFKTKYTGLPSLTLAKWKTTFQGIAIVLYYMGLIEISLLTFVIASCLSLISGYTYYALAKKGRGGITSLKIKNLCKVLFSTVYATYYEEVFPDVLKLKNVVSDDVTSVIVDMDGTITSFDQKISKETLGILHDYAINGISLIIYSNTTDESRLSFLKESGIQVYDGGYPKPSTQGYHEISKLFGIDLSRTIMIGDSPITDIPYDTTIVGGVMIIKPILPTFQIKAIVHFVINIILQRFVKFTR